MLALSQLLLRLRPRLLPLLTLLVVGSMLLAGCGGDSEESEGSGQLAVTAPECVPAPKKSGGECVPNDASNALLDELIQACPFGKDAVTQAWTEEYGWIWWNPRVTTSTAALGVDLTTGDSVCT